VRATALILLLAGLPASAAAERQLLDEVVAVVEAHSITLSEVAAETRVRLADSEGPAAANAPLDRRILAASLRKTIEERIVLSEIQRLKLFDLEPGEVETLLARLRARFPSRADYDAFTRSLELTDEEVGAILARQQRVARYLDNRLRLAAQLRDSELQEAMRGRTLSNAEREQLREQLAQEKYLKLLRELLADLRRRASVRVLDPLDAGGTVAAEQ
jgi:hypothetical protein